MRTELKVQQSSEPGELGRGSMAPLFVCKLGGLSLSGNT
jgi:hypothetical protein